MQENNFEGQVHNMMEGFTIDPSEKVWGNIQADIAGRKKSRFGILPAALLTACFLLMVFLLHDLEKRQPAAVPPVASGINATGQPATTMLVDLNKKVTLVPSKKNTIQSTGNVDLNEVDLYKTKQLVITRENKINHLTKPATTVGEGKEINKVKNKIEIEQDKDAVKAETGETVTINENKKDSAHQTIAEQKRVKINDPAVKEINEQESANKTTVNKKGKTKSKWDFFVAVTAGRFSTGNRYLGQIANSDYYSSPDALNNSGSPPSSGSFQPSPVKPGFSFSAVVKASRKFSAKSAIVIGLGYQYAGTSISTGQLLTGNSRSNANKFHNQYHFIQLPMEIQSMMGKGKKLPLYWNAGFVYSRLISADALQFDRTQGRYFKDNSYFNKNTIGISAGLSLAIFKKKQTQWLIGPQFYYSLTPVAGKGLYDKTHYSFLGIQLQKKL